MTRPRITDVFEYIRARADRPVMFSEICAAWPNFRPGQVRSQCNLLVKQGYVTREDQDVYQWNAEVYG